MGGPFLYGEMGVFSSVIGSLEFPLSEHDMLKGCRRKENTL